MNTAARPTVAVVSIDDIVLEARAPLSSMYALSPFVWRENGFEILIRAVNRSNDPTKKVARVYHGTSLDGRTFAMRDDPAIAPGPGAEDCDGCEDPTVALHAGRMFVFYTGWNQRLERGELLRAEGPSADALRKIRVAIHSSERWKNPKEATVVRQDDERWRLFFEYAAEGASRVGLGTAAELQGAWVTEKAPLEVRSGAWDDWHLSPGPIIDFKGLPLMFYNGATRDARWRIGWVLFDPTYSTVLGRSVDPLIVPPTPKGDESDIAFAASAVNVGDDVWLYYSIADREMKRAVLSLG